LEEGLYESKHTFVRAAAQGVQTTVRFFRSKRANRSCFSQGAQEAQREPLEKHAKLPRNSQGVQEAQPGLCKMMDFYGKVGLGGVGGFCSISFFCFIHGGMI
jgi:hypothetical protein